MSGFRVIGPIFDQIDIVSHTFVTDISSKAIAAITPLASVGLTVGFIAYAMAIIRGAVDMPVADFLGRSIRIGIIVSIALAGGLYQTDIADAIVTTPDALAQALITDPTQGATAANLIDHAAEQGFNYAGDALDKAGFFSSEGLGYLGMWFVVLASTILLCAVGGAFILMAKIALAILVGLGPLFIIALLWQPTSRFFEMWAAQVLNYGFVIVLFSAVFGLMMDLYGGYMANAKLDGLQNVTWTVGGAGMISVACLAILLQLPSIASGLAGGVGISYWHELRTLRGMGGSAGRAAGSAAGAAYKYSGARAGVNAAGRGAASLAKSGARRTFDYFKGRNRPAA